MNNVSPIRDESDYDVALARISELMDAAPGSAEGDLLDVLVTLVEAYEQKHWRIEPPDPIDVIKIRMEQRGLSRKDLEQVSSSRRSGGRRHRGDAGAPRRCSVVSVC